VQLLHGRRQLVAHTLELSEVEQRRSRDVHAGDRRRRRDVGKALRDDLRALALETGNLPPQRRPGRALVHARAIGPLHHDLAGKTLLLSTTSPWGRVVSIDDLLLVVGHTRLLSGRSRFYQRTRGR
jgi:hypothetical protein